MNNNLLKTMIEQGIVQEDDTEFVAKYLATGLDGTCNQVASGIFIIKSIFRIKDKLYIRAMRKDNEKIYTIDSSNITEMDGMPPDRLANVFNIKPDGSLKKIKLDEFGDPIRPGRKPKHIRKPLEHVQKKG